MAKHLDLLLRSGFRRRGFFRTSRLENAWVFYSGHWHIERSILMRCRIDPAVRTGENMAVTGSPSWNNICYRVRFRLLSRSVKPPDGGAVLYYRFKNIRNHYSIHFCQIKDRIEFVKRFHSQWFIGPGRHFTLKTNEYYDVLIQIQNAFHRVHINGVGLLETKDQDLKKGSVGVGTKYCDIEFNHVSVMSLSGCSSHGNESNL